MMSPKRAVADASRFGAVDRVFDPAALIALLDGAKPMFRAAKTVLLDRLALEHASAALDVGCGIRLAISTTSAPVPHPTSSAALACSRASRSSSTDFAARNMGLAPSSSAIRAAGSKTRSTAPNLLGSTTVRLGDIIRPPAGANCRCELLVRTSSLYAPASRGRPDGLNPSTGGYLGARAGRWVGTGEFRTAHRLFAAGLRPPGETAHGGAR